MQNAIIFIYKNIVAIQCWSFSNLNYLYNYNIYTSPSIILYNALTDSMAKQIETNAIIQHVSFNTWSYIKNMYIKLSSNGNMHINGIESKIILNICT